MTGIVRLGRLRTRTKPPGPSVPTEALWAQYKATGDQAIRNALLAAYDDIAHWAVAKTAASYTQTDTGVLLQSARLGLIDAIERFDPTRNVPFEIYAAARVTGEIIDEERASGWAPRSIGVWGAAVARATDHLEGLLGRAPTDAEIAGEMEIPLTRLEKIRRQTAEVSVEYLDRMVPEGQHYTVRTGGTTQDSLADTLDGNEATPEGAFEVAEIAERLAQGIEVLPDKLRTVLALSWRESLTLGQIADLLDISVARASQLHTEGVLALRAALAGTYIDAHLGSGS